jgi:hypothetical protein
VPPSANVTLHLNLKISAPCFSINLSPFNTRVIVVKADTHILKSHMKWWVSFVSDLSTKWRSWETASSADWSTALEREAVIRPLAEQLRLSQAIIENAAERLQLSRLTSVHAARDFPFFYI